MSITTEAYAYDKAVTTPQDIAKMATEFGAENPRVDTDEHEVEVYVNLPVAERERLYRRLREESPPSVRVQVFKRGDIGGEDIKYEIEHDGDHVVLTTNMEVYANGRNVTHQYQGQKADMSTLHTIWVHLQRGKLDRRTGPLKDSEMMRVMHTFDKSTLSKDFDTIDDIDVTADLGPIEDLIQDYGGLIPLLEAFQQSVVEGPVSDETVLEVPDNETDSDDAQGDVEALKQEYVDGDIGILELERELEDAIELDYTPTATL